MAEMQMRIAITGGIGSGKSSVLNMLENAGFKVISCDEVNGKLLSDKAYVEKIREYFPEAVTNNIIDRKKLSEIVFSDKVKLELLNGISHPIINNIILNGTKGDDIYFVEVPLLFESNSEENFDKIMLVTADKNIRIARVRKRDNRSVEEIESIIDNQLKDYNNRRIDYIITNDGDMNNLKKEVECFLYTLKK